MAFGNLKLAELMKTFELSRVWIAEWFSKYQEGK